MAAFLTPDELHNLFAAIDYHRPATTFMQEKFGRTHTFTTRTIDIDEVEDNLEIGIFVSPKMSPVGTLPDTFSTKVFHPSYWKDTANVEFDKMQDRSFGDNWIPPNTLEGKIAAELVHLKFKMDQKRIRLNEWAATQLLLNGKYTSVSPLHSPVEINLLRDIATTAAELNGRKAYQADLTTIVDNGGAGLRAWDSVGGTNTVSPLADIQQMLDISFNAIDEITIGDKAWKFLKADPDFDKVIDTRISQMGSFVVDLLPRQQSIDKLKLRGIINGIPIWTYKGEYKARNTGNIVQFVPDNVVLMTPNKNSGVKCFGAIQHGLADLKAMEVFWNSWVEDEFGVPTLQGQSAPALLHTDYRSTLAWTVTAP